MQETFRMKDIFSGRGVFLSTRPEKMKLEKFNWFAIEIQNDKGQRHKPHKPYKLHKPVLQKKKITFHENLEAQKQHELEEILGMTPEERIAIVMEMIRKIYPPVDKKDLKKIKFISWTHFFHRTLKFFSR